MQIQKITRIVDAMKSQGRVIIWLACHHKISLSQVEVATLPPNYLRDLAHVYQQTDCPFCPDLPPVPEREKMSANQLWKDAGEP